MSNNDPAGALAELITNAIDKRAAELRVALPCRVTAFDSVMGKATVVPLLQLGPNSPAPILNVPALGQRFRAEGGGTLMLLPDLHLGDTVYVVCADRHIKTAQTGQTAKPDSSRAHDINDAVIVGVFPCSLQS